jgi:hypothetical protein
LCCQLRGFGSANDDLYHAAHITSSTVISVGAVVLRPLVCSRLHTVDRCVAQTRGNPRAIVCENGLEWVGVVLDRVRARRGAGLH